MISAVYKLTQTNLKIILLAVTITLVFGQTLAQLPQLRWAHGFGAAGDERGNAVLAGKNGALYATGYFKWAVDFDPGPGDDYLYGLVNNEQAYIIKFDTSGQHIWAKGVSSTGANFGVAVAYDSDDNVYMAGNFYTVDSADFDPGPGEFYMQSQSYDFFVLKLDSAGNFIWAKKFGGAEDDYLKAMKIDNQNHLILCGTFESMADFDPGPGTSTLVASNEDGFVLKIDSSGQYVWVQQLGNSSNSEACNALALGQGGMIYITGYHASNTDFDPGPGTLFLPFTGARNLYLWKLDASGMLKNAVTMGGPASEEGLTIAVDAMENIIIGGTFFDSVDFDPGPGVSLSASNHWYDLFVCKYDSSFNYLWSYSAGGTNEDIIKSLVADSSGNIFATGAIIDTVDFDPGPSTWLLTGDGTLKIIILKLSSSGSLVWAAQPSSNGSTCEGRGIDIDSNGNMYISGSFRNLCDFDPGSGVYNLYSAGSSDIALFSWRECPGTPFAISASGKTNICAGQSVTLMADTSLSTWQWYRNQTLITGATSSTLTTSTPGLYHCSSNDLVGCVSFSNTIAVRIVCRPVDPPSERILPSELIIYPNPGNGNFTLEANSGQLSVVDVTGKIVFEKYIHQSDTHLNLTMLTPGAYLLIHDQVDGRIYQRIFISN